jgi:hypothetical protein
LVVFASGYDLFPQSYSAMLRGIARAGYVVAAPTFPLTNPATVGGPDEADIVNQPEDVRFVAHELLVRSRSPSNPLHGLLTPGIVAIAGQSDGGDTVLASGYDSCCKDPLVKAVVVMSGQRAIPGRYFTEPAPPLLAFQGTADRVNLPSYTTQFFSEALRPKFLVQLRGANHLVAYVGRSPWEAIVVRVTVAFLDHYLKGRGAVGRIRTQAMAEPRLARLES